MATITKAQYEKWSAQAGNGFVLDLMYYITWGEKTLTKKIEQPDGSIIEFKIGYENEYETRTNSYGCKWNVETGRHIPYMNITRWVPTSSGCYASSGYISDEKIGEPQTSKKYNVLCNISKTVNTDEYMKAFIKERA